VAQKHKLIKKTRNKEHDMYLTRAPPGGLVNLGRHTEAFDGREQIPSLYTQRQRFHDLGHTVITELAEMGVADHVLESISGHLSRRMLEHHSHIRIDAKRQALDALDEPRWRADSDAGADEVPPRDRSDDWSSAVTKLTQTRDTEALRGTGRERHCRQGRIGSRASSRRSRRPSAAPHGAHETLELSGVWSFLRKHPARAGEVFKR
jgi:hypothetical protein